MTDRSRLEERREIAVRDLAELDEQVEAGEIDPATAEGLRANYQDELDGVTAQLGELPAANERRPSRPEADPDEATPQPPSVRRAIIGRKADASRRSVPTIGGSGVIQNTIGPGRCW